MLPLSFPHNDCNWLERVSDGFSRGGTSVLRGCIGALDGIAIKIKEPSRNDVPNSSSYYNRKGFFALNVQAMCDSFYTFTYVGCLAAGSTHDSTAYGITSLATFLAKPDNGLPKDYWVAADDAYTCSERLLTPWPGRKLSTAKDCFNYWQSSARIFIEQAFGMLVARWGVLWRPLSCRLTKSVRVVMVCCKLHNYIIDQNSDLEVPNPSHEDDQGHTCRPDRTVHLQDECDLVDYRRRRDLDTSILRQHFTNNIHNLALRRP